MFSNSPLELNKKKEQNIDNMNLKVNDSGFSKSQLSGTSTTQLAKAF